MKKLTTALLCLLMVFSCAFCVNAEDASEVLEETPVEVQDETQEAETKVAKIGDVEYATLQAAIDAAQNGDEVVLLQDIKEHVRVSKTSNVVLNVNGKTIDNDDANASTIENKGTLSIKGNGKILNTTSGNFVLYNRGTVVIDGPDFIASKHSDKDSTGIVINEYKATINSGTFTADSNEVDTIITSAEVDAVMTINGGIFGNGRLHLYRGKDLVSNFVLYGGTYFAEEVSMYGNKDFMPEGYAFFKNEDGSYTIKDNRVKMNAFQDENGDLFIKGNEELIEKIYKGYVFTDEKTDGYGVDVEVIGFGWYGNFSNKKYNYSNGYNEEEKVIEKIDSTTLKVNKTSLIEMGFVDSLYRFSLSSVNNIEQPFEGDPVQINTGVQCQPNQQKALKLIGEVPQPIAGKTTKVDKSHFSLIGENGETLDPSSYELHWYDKFDEKHYFDTSDSVFRNGKEYRLAVIYKYTFDKENDIEPMNIKLSGSDTKTSWDNVGVFAPYGVTGGNGLVKTDWTVFLQNEGLIPTEGKIVAKNGAKEYSSIQEAIDEANRGDVITLVKDQDESIRIDRYSEITLDIGNYNLTSSQYNTIYNEGILTIKGSGQITNNSEYDYILYNGAVVTIDGPSFIGTDNNSVEQFALIYNTARLTINSGDFYFLNNSNLPWIITEEGKLTIHNGKFRNSLECFESYNGPIEIDGGTFYSYPKNMTSYLANGYCLSKNANGETVVVKSTETTVKEPTVVGNQETLDIIKKTEEFKNVQSVAIDANVKKQLTPNEVKKIETVSNNDKLDISYKIPLDLKLTAIKDDGTETNITKLDNEITITLALSAENVKALKGAKEIKVARFHDGDVTLLDAKLEGNILTFKTDRFSTYVVVAYKEASTPSTPSVTPTPEVKPETKPTESAKPSVSSPSKAGPKDLNEDGVITCNEEMGSANWIWSESKKACVYKVSNTSVK